MNFLIATSSATSTIYALTDEALDLLNFLVQVGVFFSIILVCLVVVLIAIEIYN